MFDFSYSSASPLVEIGRLGFIRFAKQTHFESPKSLESTIEKLVDLYINRFDRNKLASIFDHHGIYFKTTPEVAKTKTLAQFDALFSQKSEKHCSTCNRPNAVAHAHRQFMPLGFSETNINFLDHFTDGMYLCPECYISLFALPLNIRLVGKHLSFLLSSDTINAWWAEECEDDFRRLKNQPGTVNFLQSGTAHFANFIYDQIQQINETLYEVDDSSVDEAIWDFKEITFYQFNNFATGAHMDVKVIQPHLIAFMHHLSSDAFKSSLQHSPKRVWNRLIMRYSYVEENETFTVAKSKKNYLIERFIKGETLLSFFIKNLRNDVQKHSLIDDAFAYFLLAYYYLKEIGTMTKERLDYIKELADELSQQDNAKKLVGSIGRCKRPSDLRILLMKELKRHFDNNEKLLFDVDTLFYKILPRGGDFYETRDYLYIALYTKIADQFVGDDLEGPTSQTNEGDDDE